MWPKTPVIITPDRARADCAVAVVWAGTGLWPKHGSVACGTGFSQTWGGAGMHCVDVVGSSDSLALARGIE